MITSMVKVTFMGPRRLLMGVLDLVHSLGVVHLEPYPITDNRLEYINFPADSDEKAGLRKQIVDLLESVDRLLVSLKAPATPSTAPAWLFARHISRQDLVEAIRSADEEISPIYTQIIELGDELTMLHRYERVLAALYPLLEEATEVQNLELMGIILERRRTGILPLMEKELDQITGGRSRLFTGPMDRENMAAIIAYPPEREAMIRRLLGEESIAKIRLPTEYEDRPLATTLRLLIRRQKELPVQIRELSDSLALISTVRYGALCRIREILRERLDEFRTMALGAHSRHTFFLRGWIPEEKVQNMLGTVKSSYNDEVLVQAVPARFDEHAKVPVQLSNPPFVRIFEPLVSLLALPRYGSLDPTPFMAFFFPLFFGFILGDIAYGIVLLGLSAWTFRRFGDRPLVRSFSAIFMLSGVSTVVFGLLFGEFLGNLGQQWGLHPVLMDRARLFIPLLLIVVGLGLTHIMLGLLLNLIVSVRQGQRRHWISALANMMSLAGLVAVIVSTAGFLPRGGHIGLFLLLLGIPLLLFNEGLMGPLELLKTFGNVLSYVRLMAIGISSVVLAQVANMIGGTTESLAVGVFLALIFHTLNFALGVFSPTIHSLRLHYVEFFSKFYQPGGRPYKPFKRHRTL
ncbi:MAG: V-type ATPase 116kDa subunit family protein [bacterium]|nr:V-type ATPase 116kDa subunit family protein [bacterium]MDT8396037.1 V-type ATPase 116kDa subunit family protein [bacterium]